FCSRDSARRGMMPDRLNRHARCATTTRFAMRLFCAALGIAICAGFLMAQSTEKPKAPASDLNQLMRGLFFPHSNVVFATQRINPAEVQWAKEPSASTDPLTGVFGNWEAVENSALVLNEAADLLMTPGRKCTNGKDVPLARPDWMALVNQLRT